MAGAFAETMRYLASLPTQIRKGQSFPHDGRYQLPFRSGLPGERNHEEYVGDGSGNSIVGAAVNWICRNGPAAPLTLVRELEEGVPEIIRQHAFLRSWRRPTWIPEERRSWYSGRALWMAIYASFTIDGNAYVGKVRSETGDVVQRWYIPHWLIEPKWPEERGNTTFISHYEYRPFGIPVRVEPQDIDHFRFGIDANNTRKGWSPLKTVLREIFTDEEAARFTASVLTNFGMPGVLISPTAIAGMVNKGMNENERLALKEHFIQTFTGDHRGEPMVLSKPAELKQFGFSPQQLELSALRDVPEERVSAVLGIPASVLQLGTGLQGVKVGATMRMNWDMAWKGNLIPTQSMLADDLWAQSLPEYIEDDEELDKIVPFFDYMRAGVLHEERMNNATYWSTVARTGIGMRMEARAGLGLPVSDADKVYIPQPGVELVSPLSEAVVDDGTGDGTDDGTGDGAGDAVPPPDQLNAVFAGRVVQTFHKNGRAPADGPTAKALQLLAESHREGSERLGAAIVETAAANTRATLEIAKAIGSEIAKAIASAPQPITNLTVTGREPGAWIVEKDAKGRATGLKPVKESTKSG